MNGAPLIACARCAISKARCDRKVPCSQCVARNYVCQPRCTSRKPRPPRRPTRQSQALAASSATIDPDSDHVAYMEQLPNFMLSDSQTPSNELFDFSSTAFPPETLDLSSYEDFIGLSYPASSSNGDAVNGNTSNTIFSSMPWLGVSDNRSGSLDSQVSPLGVESPDAYNLQQTLSLGPRQPATPAPSTAQTIQGPQTHSPGLQDNSTPYKKLKQAHNTGNGTSDDVLGDMVDLLAQQDVWHDLPESSSDVTQVLPHDARDRIVAAVQLLLHRALQTHDSLSPSRHGVFGRIVVLPPSHVLIHFVELYAARVDIVQPYLSMAGSPRISIKEILQVDMADVGILLLILLITQGAMFTDHRESLILADGLTEICRLALNDVLESRSMAQPIVGGSALQLLTLCAWSGRDSFASFAMSKRGQYLSMIKQTSLLQPEAITDNLMADGMDPWERWKEVEQRNRLVYAWVYVDLEISLLHDLPPVLSINDLNVPLPQDTNFWHAQTKDVWLEHYGASGTRLDEERQTLNSLFRRFLQGRLDPGEDKSFHHLRLLLHPLQAMVLEQQQLLRIFDTDEPSNRHRVLSKIKILGRLQETQDLLQQLTMLLNRAANSATEQDNQSPVDPMACVSMLMLHLLTLNAFTSVPEIERCAREEPPVSDAEYAEIWRRVQCVEDERSILFHAGQVFRLIDSLHINARPPWWPVAIYRAGLACWSLRSSTRTSPIDQLLGTSINALLPNDEDSFLNSSAGTAIFTLPDGRCLPVLEGSNSLQYCIGALETHPTRLVRGVLAKMRFFSDRWSP